MNIPVHACCGFALTQAFTPDLANKFASNFQQKGTMRNIYSVININKISSTYNYYNNNNNCYSVTVQFPRSSKTRIQLPKMLAANLFPFLATPHLNKKHFSNHKS